MFTSETPTLNIGAFSYSIFPFPTDVFARCALLCHFAGALLFHSLRTWPHYIFSLKISCSLQRAKVLFLQKGKNVRLF